MATVVLAEVVRSGFVESVHAGSAVLVHPDGAVERYGEPDRPIFPRSSLKPLQAVALLRAGLALPGDADGELLALCAASHSGETFHLEGVRAILAGAGLDEAALQTPPDWPLDEQARLAMQAAGSGPTALAMNCSGKHAAMLATCVARGWDTASYLSADHPVQQEIKAVVAELTGEPVAAVGVDGCGAPLYAVSLTSLARAFASLAIASPGTPGWRLAEAMRAHPHWVSGTRRDERALMAGVPGLIAKSGAEAVYAAALPDGRAAAVKIADGSQRARPIVMAALLARLGVTAPVIDDQITAPVYGGGRVVGHLRPSRLLLAEAA